MCLFIFLKKYTYECSDRKMCAMCIVSPRMSWRGQWACSWETDIINNGTYKSTNKLTTVRKILFLFVVFLSLIFRMLIFIIALKENFRLDLHKSSLFMFFLTMLRTQFISQCFHSECCFGNLNQKDYLKNLILFTNLSDISTANSKSLS